MHAEAGACLGECRRTTPWGVVRLHAMPVFGPICRRILCRYNKCIAAFVIIASKSPTKGLQSVRGTARLVFYVRFPARSTEVVPVVCTGIPHR